jgi:hypothetical protein
MKNIELFPGVIPDGVALMFRRDPLQDLYRQLLAICNGNKNLSPFELQQLLAARLNSAINDCIIHDYAVVVHPDGEFADVMFQPKNIWTFTYIRFDLT